MTATAEAPRPGAQSALSTPEQEGPPAYQLALDLERAGALTETGLVLTDPAFAFERWVALGRLLGRQKRSTSWALGDWLNFGEALYEDRAVQAVGGSRYDAACQVTGLDVGTLRNYASVCSRVARSRRRPGVPFSVHAAVAPLEPAEQAAWLDRFEAEGMSREEFRRALRDEGALPGREQPEWTDGDGESKRERLERAASLVVAQASALGDGRWAVPGEAIAQLREAVAR